MTAIATKEPGYNTILFKTKKEREQFEAWVYEKHIEEYIKEYIREGNRMWKILHIWEYDEWDRPLL